MHDAKQKCSAHLIVPISQKTVQIFKKLNFKISFIYQLENALKATPTCNLRKTLNTLKLNL